MFFFKHAVDVLFSECIKAFGKVL